HSTMTMPEKPTTPPFTSPLAGEVAQLGPEARSEARRGDPHAPSLARKLRAIPTASEVALWRILRPFRTGGYHFRKRLQIGTYVVDFACMHGGLVIEVDGITHLGERAWQKDMTRAEYLRGRGFAVLHIPSDDVMREP